MTQTWIQPETTSPTMHPMMEGSFKAVIPTPKRKKMLEDINVSPVSLTEDQNSHINLQIFDNMNDQPNLNLISLPSEQVSHFDGTNSNQYLSISKNNLRQLFEIKSPTSPTTPMVLPTNPFNLAKPKEDDILINGTPTLAVKAHPDIK